MDLVRVRRGKSTAFDKVILTFGCEDPPPEGNLEVTISRTTLLKVKNSIFADILKDGEVIQIFLKRSPAQQAVFKNNVLKYLESYPDIGTALAITYVPSTTTAAYLKMIQEEADFYKLDDLKNAASMEYSRIVEQLAREKIQSCRTVQGAFKTIVRAFEFLLENTKKKPYPWVKHRNTHLQIHCYKRGFFSAAAGKIHLFECTKLAVYSEDTSTRHIIDHCDVVRAATLKKDGMVAPWTVPEFIELNRLAFSQGDVSNLLKDEDHALTLRHDVLETAITTFVGHECFRHVNLVIPYCFSDDDIHIFRDSETEVRFDFANATIRDPDGHLSGSREFSRQLAESFNLGAWQYVFEEDSEAFLFEGFTIHFKTYTPSLD